MALSSLTDREQNLLMQLSYCNVDPNTGTSKTMGDLIASLRDSGALSSELASAISSSPALMDLKLVGYSNYDSWTANTTDPSRTSGFVGYAFEDSSGDRGLVFRGTQDAMDWVDNAGASAFGDSLQVQHALDFFATYGNSDGGNYVFGHSKGGNLATEVFINNLDIVEGAHVFNAQPVNWLLLTPEQQAALRSSRYDFAAVDRDLVSKIGVTPYETRFVQLNPDYADTVFGPHDLKAALYDDSGNGYAIQPQPFVDKLLEAAVAGLFHYLATQPWALGTVAIATAIEWVVDGMSQLQQFYEVLVEKASGVVNKIAGLPAALMGALSNFFAELGNALKKRLQDILGRLGRAAARMAGPVRVSTGQLRHVAATLGRVQGRISTIDRRLDRLTSLIEPEKKVVLIAIDWSVGYDYRLARCISYLNSAAQRFESGELALVTRAAQYRT